MNNYKKYGHFNDDGTEFIITKFDTPKPWMNYIWNSSIHSGIDQRGRGESIFRSSSGEKTNLINDRLLYIKNKNTQEIWTVGWDPVRLPQMQYSCRHGLGYTIVTCKNNGIVAQLSITTAESSPVEMWKISIHNENNKVETVSLYPYVSFDLGGFEVYGGLENNVISKVDTHNNVIMAKNNSRSRLGTKNNCFFACSSNPIGFESSKTRFLGDRYGSIESPAGVKNENLGTFAGSNEEQVGIFQFDCVLEPGACTEIQGIVGPFENEDEIPPLCNLFLNNDSFEEAICAWKNKNKCFANVDVDLQDDYLNPLINHWAKHQLSMMMDWSRGWTMGYRDTLQDAQAFCSLDNRRAKTAIQMACKHQLKAGMALRGYWPIDSNPYADGGVWLAFAVNEYVRETGEYSILKEEIEYYDGGRATVWEHVKLGLDWIYQRPGRHRLTRMQFGDWNDSLNIGTAGEGESVWLTMALIVAAKQLSELAAQIGEQEAQSHYHQLSTDLIKIVEEECWDGEWYLRGYTDNGSKVGSVECKEGMIFSEVQAWSIIAGLTQSRWETTEESMQKHLMTDYGMIVCYPAFKTYDSQYGRISTLPPGWGENASAYCHVSAFKAVADCIRGDADTALDTITRILAINPKHTIEISGAEPYGFTNMFRGPENPWAGLSLRSWYTGTTGWILRCITQWMLGIKPEFDGLSIDPILPSSWKNVQVRRMFRGAEYDIEIISVDNAAGTQILLDGKTIDGKILPIGADGSKHRVLVKVGKRMG